MDKNLKPVGENADQKQCEHKLATRPNGFAHCVFFLENEMMSFVKKAALATALASSAMSASAATTGTPAKGEPIVVLVHGAFSDGSAWSKVIPLLQAQGLKVVAVQNPLTSLADDVATTKRALEAQTGPVVLVGHSYGGVVITEAGSDEHVKSLVYVAAYAPGEGQSIADLNKDYPTPAGFSELVADKRGFLTLTRNGVAKYLAQDVSPEQAALMEATQKPTNGKNFEEKVGVPAWKTKPSWYIVAEHDFMLQPALQKVLAKNISAHVVTLSSSHTPQISQPAEVAKVILEAVAEVAKK
ncbi:MULTISPECIES: alpha/beta fold hydrolase [unclassified Rhizobium]|uniref:alpha/beta fold hydrolase n=1 Tax=unclassified Rhizobium TaxID=2613769 RepID=UPI001EF040B6|nr:MULTISPECIES: alpha/beta hydrolase [unclassified Rhizobium]